MDNHADTDCFGAKNANTIHFGRVHCVSIPTRYTKQLSISICTGFYALKLDSGEVLILEFGHSLWIGDRMKKSLINPNQRQKFEIKMCDEPNDPQSKLGIKALSK